MLYTEEEIQELVKVETKLTKLAFIINETLGKDAIKSSITNFIKLLEKQKGVKIVPAFDLDYRTFLVVYFESLMRTVDDKHKEHVATEILLSTKGV